MPTTYIKDGRVVSSTVIIPGGCKEPEPVKPIFEMLPTDDNPLVPFPEFSDLERLPEPNDIPDIEIKPGETIVDYKQGNASIRFALAAHDLDNGITTGHCPKLGLSIFGSA